MSNLSLFTTRVCTNLLYIKPLHGWHLSILRKATKVALLREANWELHLSWISFDSQVTACCCTFAGLWSSPDAPGGTGCLRPFSLRSEAGVLTMAAPHSLIGWSSIHLNDTEGQRRSYRPAKKRHLVILENTEVINSNNYVTMWQQLSAFQTELLL